MKRFFALSLLVCTALLGGCAQVRDVIDDYITPSEASLNGYTVERDASGTPTGNVDLNVSALDDSGEPIDGKMSNVSATVDKVVTPSGTVTAMQEYVATAEIKFDIELEEIINAVLDLDQSGSMRETDPERKRVDAAQDFIGRIKEQDRLAIMAFLGRDENFRNSVLLQDFTSDKTALNAAVEEVGQQTTTPIWDSVLDTLELHERDIASEQGGNASRVVVLFTDGKRNGGAADFSDALSEARGSGIKFFTIGLGAGPEEIDMSELQELAEETGGTFANVDSADELDTLFTKVFNAIRASGVITLTLSPVPPAGTLVQGTVTFEVSGETFKLPYAVQF
jgi:Mg-chelatase subunit ChlD